MTGFARAEGRANGSTWVFEIRSVNGRSLDLRFRLPQGHDQLEAHAREYAQRRLSRGTVNVNLDLDRASTAPQLRLNEQVLGQVLAAVARMREITGSLPVTVEGLLAVRGVLESVEPGESSEQSQSRHAALMETFARCLDDLVLARGREGARLQNIVTAQIDEIERLVAVVATSPARKPDAIARRLEDQVQRLAGASHGLDPLRLYEEAIILATKADVEEELQRLTMHVANARELLLEDAPAGRKFDFLTQELNREANTLCSKANDPDISRAGLAMKVVVDQMREQVANIE